MRLPLPMDFTTLMVIATLVVSVWQSWYTRKRRQRLAKLLYCVLLQQQVATIAWQQRKLRKLVARGKLATVDC